MDTNTDPTIASEAPQAPVAPPASPDPAPATPAQVADPAAAAASTAAAGDASTTDPVAEPTSPLTTPPPNYKLPEGVPAQVGNWAQKNGLTQEQLDASLQFFGSVNQANVKAQQQSLRQMGEAHLQNTWGENAPYNLQLAQRALRQNDPTGALTKMLNESGYGNHPAVLDFLHAIGRSMQEGGFLKSSTNRPPGAKSAAQLLFGDNHPSNEE